MKKILFISLVIAFAFLASCQTHEHVYDDWTITEKPTCTEEGEEVGICKCGAQQTRSIATKSHTYGEWKIQKEPTCSEKGVQVSTCVCGAQQTRSIATTTHSYGEWEIQKEPTCSENGVQIITCKCGAQQSMSIATISHTYGEWETTQPSTCAKEGAETHSCKNCGKRENRSTSKTKHNWKNSTCTNPKICLDCGTTEEGAIHKHISNTFACKLCEQQLSALDYKYLALGHFRDIRSKEQSAKPEYATMVFYNNSEEEVCLLVKIYYTVGTKEASKLFLHNMTKFETIEDPKKYYGDIANEVLYKISGFDGARLSSKYSSIVNEIFKKELDMYKNPDTPTVSAEYLAS